MKKTLIALMALAGVAAAETADLTFADFNTTLQEIAELNPTEYTLTLTVTGSDYNNYGSGFLVKFAENWGVFTQAGAYIAMDNTNANDRAWVNPTGTSGTTFTWTSTDTTAASLLDSWVSKTSTGGNAQPGVNGMTITLAVTEAGSVVTLGMTNGTTSVIETGYVVNLADVKLVDGTGGGANEGLTSISGASITYASIPEPTTATLSLLALAGLAARRRRR